MRRTRLVAIVVLLLVALLVLLFIKLFIVMFMDMDTLVFVYPIAVSKMVV